MRVTMPPSSEPKARGINSLEAETRALRDIDTAAGIRTAVAPTLFITPDMAPTVAISNPTSRLGRVPAILSRRSPIRLATPV